MEPRELSQMFLKTANKLRETYPRLSIEVNFSDDCELVPFRVIAPNRADFTLTPEFDDGVSWTVKGTFKGEKFECVFSTDWSSNTRDLWEIALEEIEEYDKSITSGSFIPNVAQKRLAEEVTRFVHGEEGLQIALKVTEAAAPGSKATLDPEVLEEIAKDMPNTSMVMRDIVDQKYTDVAAQAGLSSSKGEIVRLIKNGGAYLNNEKVEDQALLIESKHIIGGKYILLAAGKKKKILIKIEKELA